MNSNFMKWFATLNIIWLAIFLIYYPYRVLKDVIPFAFTKPELWQNHWLVDHTTEIPFSLRLSYFLLWAFPILATVVMTAIAIHFFYLLRKGIYFDFRTVRDLQLLGLSACFAGFGVLLGNSLTSWLITILNTKEKHSIHFGYEPTEVSLMLTGIGLFLGGWIIKALVMEDQENKEFI